MPISRGLVISLGASVLGCSLLFLYFRNRISSIENKVNLMFDLIQNHQQPVVYERENEPNMTFSVTEKQETEDKILVSEDEEDDEEDDDAFDSDDSEEVSDSEDNTKLNLNNEDKNTLILENIEQLNSETLEQTNMALDEVDSLDEINDSDMEEEVEETANNKNDDVANDTEKNEDDVKAETVKEFNYASLKVLELKSLCQDRHLSGYSSLKKQALIDLLKANE